MAFVTVADSNVASPPVVIFSANATVLTPPAVLDRVMTSTSPLRPICAPVKRTDSTSTWSPVDWTETGPFELVIVSVGVPVDPV